MKNKIIRCTLISEDQFKLEERYLNKESNYTYYENSAKIITDGVTTYCSMDMIVDSITKHLKDKTLTFSKKTTINDGNKEIGTRYEFKDKKNKFTTIVIIPKEIIEMKYDKYPKYDFIGENVKKIENLNKSTNRIRNLRIKRRIGAAIIGAATITGSLLGTAKIIYNSNKNQQTTPAYTYYDEIGVPRKNVTEIAKNIEESYKNYSKKK